MFALEAPTYHSTIDAHLVVCGNREVAAQAIFGFFMLYVLRMFLNSVFLFCVCDKHVAEGQRR